MLHVLLVSTSEKTTGILKEYLNMEDCMNITACKTASRARRTALETAFDMIIINYPLADEREYELPQDLAEKSDASIMLMVPAEVYDIIADRMEKAGIYVLLKPVNKTVLLCVLRFAIVTQKRIRAMRMRNRSLKDRLSEIKVIDRAKRLLMEHEQLSEAQAHRYLEKRAMDSQMSRLQVAEQLLKKYQLP